MKPDIMKQLTTVEREDLIMKEVIKSLTNLGGTASRNEIERDIYNNSLLIPEDYIDFKRRSKKTGKEYKPFKFQFNFAIKYLILTDFIHSGDRRILELTEKGRKVHLDQFNPTTEVREVLESMEQKKEKIEAKSSALLEDSEDEILNAEKVDDIWRDQLKEALQKMAPEKFEMFCRGLMNRMGIELDKSIGIQYVADGGLDGFGYITADDFRTTRVALQAKRWEPKVSSPEIDKFRGAMDKYNAEYGIFITTSDFTRAAIEASRIGTRVITLINGDDICDLVAKYEFYVTPVTTYELKKFYFDKE